MRLRDAVALAETIEKCFERQDFSAPALKPYENARRKQTRFIQAQAERTAQITTTENSFYSWLGKRALKKAGANPEVDEVSARSLRWTHGPDQHS